MVKILTLLVSTVSNSHLFLLTECEMQKLLTFVFSKNIILYVIFNYPSFNDMLTNEIISFEQLGPVFNFFFHSIISIKLSLLLFPIL